MDNPTILRVGMMIEMKNPSFKQAGRQIGRKKAQETPYKTGILFSQHQTF
jgi:hypothetical protein